MRLYIKFKTQFFFVSCSYINLQIKQIFCNNRNNKNGLTIEGIEVLIAPRGARYDVYWRAENTHFILREPAVRNFSRSINTQT